MKRFLLLLAVSGHVVFAKEPASTDSDAALVRSLLGEDLSGRTFAFATVAEACSG
ncbi:MAG: hypothetical protein RLZZ214_3220, partial [Verrucomicrobiota bacterium]